MAVRWYRKAAKQGFAEAQHNLGTLYGHGQGVPRDFAQAAHYCRLAAMQGHALAQSKIGFMYQRGMGVPKDFAKAVYWYREAAGNGDPVAQFNLGLMYQKKSGIENNPSKAYFWFSLAARRSHGRTGKRAASLRDQSAKRLSAKELAVLNAKLNDWKPRIPDRG